MNDDRPLAKGEQKYDANRDPITGKPGSHPVGTGVGAAAGGVAAGAAIGTVAGPLGTLAGAAVGAVLGGLAGKRIAESIDPTRENEYWLENHSTRPYIDDDATYDDYGPAYRYGVDSYSRYGDRGFDDADPELSAGWSQARGDSRLEWSDARHAARDSWNRVKDTVERVTPGDSDRDGR